MSHSNNLEIFLLRHGETQCNKLGLWYCPEESHINEEGIKQAEKIREMINVIRPDMVFSSPFQRCMDTAKIVLKDLPAIKPTIKECLGERGFRGVEGLNTEGINSMFGVTMDSPITDHIDFVQDVENSRRFHNRIEECMNSLILESSGSKRILIVTHGGVLWSIVSRNFQMKPKPRTFLNCALLGLRFSENSFYPFYSCNMREGWFSEINPSWSGSQL
ncbi:MAG: histidine phosphatase family protein [Cuniculiplasma sp.]